MTLLELQKITGGYDASRDILDGVSLRLGKGESVGIIGLNGSGKSTLGKAAMNMLPRRTGRVLLDGVDVTAYSTSRLAHAGVGFLMQGAPVFDQLTVAENLRLAAGGEAALKDAIQRLTPIFPRLIQQRSVGFPACASNSSSTDKNVHAPLYRRRADKLSGGERHQLALCLALVKPAKLLILDEPSAGLDPAAADVLYKILETVRNETHVSILLIEQNVKLAFNFCRRVLVMRQGRLEDAKLETNFSSLSENRK